MFILTAKLIQLRSDLGDYTIRVAVNDKTVAQFEAPLIRRNVTPGEFLEQIIACGKQQKVL